MKKIVDSPNETGTGGEPEDNSEYSLDDLAVVEETENSDDDVTQTDDADLPEKYKGKSVADVAKMHSELEQRFGQQGNEVGELRRTLDQYILNRLQDGPQTKPPEEKVDYFEDPEKAVEHAIENSDQVKKLKEAAVRAERAALQSELKSRHPSYETFLQDSGFQEWIKGSKLRQRLLLEADQKYDIEAADELFSEWEGIQKSKQSNAEEVVESEKTARKQAVKKASTGNARGSQTGRSSKKVYRRADIVELMKTDPRRYESLAAEIRQAYADGRVR